MKYLYLIRHGKSSWDYPELQDRERPLKKRGRSDAKIMARLILEMEIKPDQIISSPANRAYSSAVLIAKEISYPLEKVSKDDRLYFSGMNSIYKVIRDIDDDHERAFIFGHNPDFTNFANDVSSRHIDNLPTTGLVGIAFNIDKWKDASSRNGKLTLFETPKMHR